MTRTEAAIKLLRLGPLTLREFVEITGWGYRCCLRTLASLCLERQVHRLRRGNRYMPSVYEVAHE